MIKSIIVAASTNHVIGNRGKLPWHLPADLMHFKKTTFSHPIIMGRLTFESIGRVLPGRINIVLTRRKDYVAPVGCIVFHCLEEAFSYIGEKGYKKVFIIGGGKVYEEALALVDKVYMTRVHADVIGDCFFPFIDGSQWKEVDRQDFKADDKHTYDYSFIVYDRK